MRLASVADFRRRLRTKSHQWPFSLSRVAIDGIPGLGSHELQISFPLTVISGANGVGKTSLLRAIWAAAAPTTAVPVPGAEFRLTSGRVTLDYRWNGLDGSSEVTFVDGRIQGGAALPIEVVHLDASSDPMRHQREFCRIVSRDDLTNGVGERELSRANLQEVRYVCRRDYIRVVVYEIESMSEVFPFFVVEADGLSYDSRTMGAGELSALYIWWKVDRAAENSILLIEEPETFLSPVCQESVAHFLIASIVDKHLVAILSSHSAKIIDNVDDICRAFLYREGSVSKIQPPPVPVALLESVGLRPAVRTLVMVEDFVAEIALTTILAKLRPELLHVIEVRAQKGESDLKEVLLHLPSKFHAVSVVAVFDGDMRGQIASSRDANLIKNVQPFCAFLPGESSMEELLRAHLRENLQQVENATGIVGLGAILSALQGTDPHEWLAGVARLSSVPLARLLGDLVRLWLAVVENEDLARQTVTGLLAACRGAADHSSTVAEAES